MGISEADSFTRRSEPVRLDPSEDESVGGPRGTVRSSGEFAVQTKTPMDSCSPVSIIVIHYSLFVFSLGGAVMYVTRDVLREGVGREKE